MAIMIPADVEQFATAGEGRFYRFLETVAKPDSKYVSWYSPDVEGKAPGFVLFSEDAGLIVFEVKDWDIGQITAADSQRFWLNNGYRQVAVTNPQLKARRYKYSLVEKMAADGELIEGRCPARLGKVKVPVNHGVILVNIDKAQYLEKGLDQVTDVDKIFFRDELHPRSSLCTDPSGLNFNRAIMKKFPPRFPWHLSNIERNHLRRLVFPKAKIDLPPRKGGANYSQRLEQLKVLDFNQEALARQFNGGHRLIKGPSGTGKTIILVHKAAYLQHFDTTIRRILIVCYNLTLCHYIKRLIRAKRVDSGENGIEVYSFHELCGRILGKTIDHSTPDSDDFKYTIDLALREVRRSRFYFDAILVDEGQDFSDDMLKIVTGLINRSTNNLTIALDDNQNIYRQKRSWKKLGIHIAGRHTHTLNFVYRHTVELTRFYSRFVHRSDRLATQNKSDQQEMFPGFNDAHGPPPCLIQFPSLQDIMDYVIGTIHKLTRQEMLPLSEIAVMYATSGNGGSSDLFLADQLSTAFSAHGICFHWVSRDARSRLAYDITTDGVTLSSIHSLKGFDFNCVFLLGLEALAYGKWTGTQIERLTYVAVTRARDRLYIPYLEKASVIQRLIECR